MSPREQAPISSEPATTEDPEPDRAAYLAFVAHEMRNPLSTALWSAELLTRMSPEERGGARGEKLAGMCLRTLLRLRHLVEDHFLSERLAIRGVPVRAEPLPVADVLRVAAGRAGVQFGGGVGSLVVSADRAMLERAFEALLAAAGREGAPVQVSTERAGSTVSLIIRGAAPGEGAFRKPDRSTPSDPTGRALALLAAQVVAEAHGGSLDATADGYLLSLPADDGSGGSGEDR